MNYDSAIYDFILNTMKSKTKLHFKDVVKYLVPLVTQEFPNSSKRDVENQAERVFDFYSKENTERAAMDEDDGFKIWAKGNGIVAYSNVWNTFIQRQKIRQDKKGTFFVVIKDSKPLKVYI